MIVVYVQILYVHSTQCTYNRYNDGSQRGHVKSAGQSFTDHASRNGQHILLARVSCGDVQDVKHQVRLYRMNTDVGVREWRIRMSIDLPRLIAVHNHVCERGNLDVLVCCLVILVLLSRGRADCRSLSALLSGSSAAGDVFLWQGFEGC
jgi:hypothetical protein